MTDLFRIEFEGARATITLDRPARHNALQAGDLPLLEEMLDAVEATSEVRVMVLTGAGEKTFCSGYDIGDIAHTDWGDQPLDRALDRLENLTVPTICAMNGGAYGGGADLALACDLRIGVRGMRVFVPPAKLGLHYHVSGVRRFVERLGLGAAKRLLLACESFEDEALLGIGYLDYLVTAAEFRARTDALAEAIAGFAPLSLRAMKRTLNQVARGQLDLDAARQAAATCLASEDFAEGAAAFAEKRPPRFRGE